MLSEPSDREDSKLDKIWESHRLSTGWVGVNTAEDGTDCGGRECGKLKP